MNRPLRILYCAGPGDVVGTYRHWRAGYDDPAQVAITYSGQFYELCRQLGAEAYVISYCERPDRLVDGPIRVEHRPLPFRGSSGVLFRLGQIWSGIRFTLTAARYRPDVLLTMGGAEWFSLGLLPWLGIKVIVTFHGHLWRLARPPRGIEALVWRLNGRFFRKGASAFMYISDSIADQLRGLTGPLAVPMMRFAPTYRAGLFRPAASTPSPAPPPPFRVFYAGRVEHNKGVFDLLEVAKRFAAEGRTEIEFDLCGEGHALEELRRQAEQAGVSARFRCHGHVEKGVMASWYQRSHLVVAPTTSDSIEGLNKVVVESVLASRPVVTSRVCPALEYVRDAVVEVPPDDARAYGDAILRLVDDTALYEEKVRGCGASTGQFYDPTKGWGATLRKVLGLIGAVPEARQAVETGSVESSAVTHAANAR